MTGTVVSWVGCEREDCATAPTVADKIKARRAELRTLALEQLDGLLAALGEMQTRAQEVSDADALAGIADRARRLAEDAHNERQGLEALRGRL